MSLKSLCIAMAFASMTTACALSAPPSQPPQLQASLREPCPDLAEPADGTRATILRWMVDAARMYRECQSRHRRTVQAWPMHSQEGETQ